MPRYRIIPNVICYATERLAIQDAHFGESLLPDWRIESEFPSRAECEAALHELHGAFNTGVTSYGDQGMEMVGHDHEFV